MADRRVDGTLAHRLLLVAAAAASLSTPLFAQNAEPGGEAAADRVWYQIEVVLFAQRDARVPTQEQVRDNVRPIWPAGTAALGPTHPEPVRPSPLDEIAMQWDDDYRRALLMRVTPGLTLADEDLIAWLRRQSDRGRATGLEWRDGLETLTWTGPDPVRGAASDDDTATETATVEPSDQPLPTTLDESDSTDPGTGEAPDPALAEADEDLDAAVDADADADEAGETEIPIPASLAFRTVAPELRQLGDEVRRLERARGIRVLAHLAWRQGFAPEAPGIPVQVLWRDPVDDEPALLGTVAIDLRRFLHASLDLYWRVGNPEGEPLWTHVLETRRMRSGELHYVDHPHVGALIRIERFALAEPLAADQAVVPLLENEND